MRLRSVRRVRQRLMAWNRPVHFTVHVRAMAFRICSGPDRWPAIVAVRGGPRAPDTHLELGRIVAAFYRGRGWSMWNA